MAQSILISQPEDILIYAFYLAGLTYFLGVIFYALPIPLKRIKKWGPLLIKDSIYTLVLLSIYNYIIYSSHYILHLLGVSWSNYFLNESQNLNTLSTIYVIFSAIKIAGSANIITGVVTSSILSFTGLNAFINATSDSLLAYLILYYFSLIIYHLLPWFLAMGVLFMSLPFRLGRSIGSGLIASSIVFYIGLPLMTNFSNALVGILYGGIISSLSVNTILSLDEIAIDNLIGYFGIYYIISRVLFIFILVSITGQLANIIGDSSGKMLIRFEPLMVFGKNKKGEGKGEE